MNRKYRIGFFLVIVLMMILLEAGYQWSYNRRMERQEESQVLTDEINLSEESVKTDGNAKENSEYLLKELNGYVIVYLGDEQTVYEVTAISVDELPEEIQTRIMEGMRLNSTSELYAFLENYSS